MRAIEKAAEIAKRNGLGDIHEALTLAPDIPAGTRHVSCLVIFYDLMETWSIAYALLGFLQHCVLQAQCFKILADRHTQHTPIIGAAAINNIGILG